MTLLIAAVVVIGLVSVANLLFALGVIRRLREHTEMLARLKAGGVGGGGVMLPAGAPIEDFAGTTLDGEHVSATMTADGRLLAGFFSVGCEYCATQLPYFVEQARQQPGG